jgi:radical SAM-linked protein
MITVPKAPDATPAASPAATGPPDKVRIRFRKDGALRLLSHHDLMRTFERMLRRADLPFRRTQGFHPKPRLVFALSLPLGVVGGNEVVELELDHVLPPEEVHERLARQAPPGLAIHSVCRIGPRCTARVRGLTYALPIPVAGAPGLCDPVAGAPGLLGGPERLPALRERIAEVLAAPECWIDRNRPPSGRGRRLDIRPFLRDLRLEEPRGADIPVCRLLVDLWLTDSGTARPEEVVRLLGLQDLLESGAVFERTRLELEDELPPSCPAAPDGPAIGAAGGQRTREGIS